ncbi:PAS domain-containing protein [Streptomyces zagrosensis]|uniref:PAS domain-containing protein n=1 Tax=Streptomyces zagrosensis TaxID=1042984 RepID=A0A7W9QCN5_9ACTN|nr:PAS domain-containing protein [Streptomyces zagrosensis]MBB5937841.1 PAS domain-containing protein [Streptomyces zagrosensis]
MTKGSADGPAECGEGEGWDHYFLTLLDRLPLPVALCRADGEVVVANPAMAGQWGVAPGRLCGRNLLDLFRPRDTAQLRRAGEALRLGYRSRYPVRVRWRVGGDGAERAGASIRLVTRRRTRPRCWCCCASVTRFPPLRLSVPR